jgi:transcriptional regulator with XRE-family HTH domain
MTNTQTTTVPTVELHHRMAIAMEFASVTRSEMAEYLGVSGNTISNYTKGHTAVPTSVQRLWALRCGVPYQWLVTGEYDHDDTGLHTKWETHPWAGLPGLEDFLSGTGPPCTERQLTLFAA